MNIKYQIVFIGHQNIFRNKITDTLFHHTDELGLPSKSVSIIDETNFQLDFKAIAPTVCIYTGGSGQKNLNIDILDQLINNSCFVFPIVDDLANFSSLVPPALHTINGFELKSDLDIEPLVGNILECLGLLRQSRRLFISYKRNESSGLAIQLFEQLEKAGFDVFLDTHSIRPGDVFQEELWHRMVDTDIVVLLNTPGFLESQWTQEELAKANSMSIGILQLIWPTHTAEKMSELSIQHLLWEKDFKDNVFSDSKSQLLELPIELIISEVESLRARSIAARRDSIIAEFMASAKTQKLSCNLQPEKFITITRAGNKKSIVIPTIGIPSAFTYNQSEDLIKKIKGQKQKAAIYLLYDHRNIRQKWLNHLSWLDGHLPIRTVKITEIDNFLNDTSI